MGTEKNKFMRESFFHYLLLVIFSVFVITSNTHAMSMQQSMTPTEQITHSQMSDVHGAMSHCEQNNEKANTYCNVDCSCSLSHCHKTPSVLPKSLIAIHSERINYLTDKPSPLQLSTVTPMKRPPKA
jgi:hypothetical protein